MSPTPTITGDLDHSLGSHSVSQSMNTECTFSGGYGLQYCDTGCAITKGLVTTELDTGETSSGNCHQIGSDMASGAGQGTNGGVTCSAPLTGGAVECSSAACSKCTINVSVGIVSGGASTIMNVTNSYPNNCNAVNDPTTLNSITVTPANTTGNAAPGAMTMTATGNYSGGGTQNLSIPATWSSSNPAVAAAYSGGVIDFPGPSGTATITATYGNVSGSTTVNTKASDGGGGGGGGCNLCVPGQCGCGCSGCSPLSWIRQEKGSI